MHKIEYKFLLWLMKRLHREGEIIDADGTSWFVTYGGEARWAGPPPGASSRVRYDRLELSITPGRPR